MNRLPQGCKIAKTLKIKITLVYVCDVCGLGDMEKLEKSQTKYTWIIAVERGRSSCWLLLLSQKCKRCKAEMMKAMICIKHKFSIYIFIHHDGMMAQMMKTIFPYFCEKLEKYTYFMWCIKFCLTSRLKSIYICLKRNSFIFGWWIWMNTEIRLVFFLSALKRNSL